MCAFPIDDCFFSWLSRNHLRFLSGRTTFFRVPLQSMRFIASFSTWRPAHQTVNVGRAPVTLVKQPQGAVFFNAQSAFCCVSFAAGFSLASFSRGMNGIAIPTSKVDKLVKYLRKRISHKPPDVLIYASWDEVFSMQYSNELFTHLGSVPAWLLSTHTQCRKRLFDLP